MTGGGTQNGRIGWRTGEIARPAMVSTGSPDAKALELLGYLPPQMKLRHFYAAPQAVSDDAR